MPDDRPPAPIVSITGPAIDSAIVDTLEDALAEARRGELSSVALIVARRGGGWGHTLAGDTRIDAMSALNLRLDALKRLVLEQFTVTDESRK
jgi:hypothetical protein